MVLSAPASSMATAASLLSLSSWRSIFSSHSRYLSTDVVSLDSPASKSPHSSLSSRRACLSSFHKSTSSWSLRACTLARAPASAKQEDRKVSMES